MHECSGLATHGGKIWKSSIALQARQFRMVRRLGLALTQVLCASRFFLLTFFLACSLFPGTKTQDMRLEVNCGNQGTKSVACT